MPPSGETSSPVRRDVRLREPPPPGCCLPLAVATTGDQLTSRNDRRRLRCSSRTTNAHNDCQHQADHERPRPAPTIHVVIPGPHAGNKVKMTVGSSIRQLHDFGRLPRVVLGSRGSSQAGSSSRLGSAALPAPSIGIRCRRPERIDHGRAETHRCRAICDSNAARRRSTERPRTRLASQQLYARLERRECFSTLWTGATPRSGVGPAKTGVGCCLVMPAVHRPALCLAQRFVRRPE